MDDNRKTRVQETFDKVARHLLTQGEKSCLAARDWNPAYRGDDGRMCAIGCLIPDGLYNPELEGRNVVAIRNQRGELASLLGLEDEWMYNMLRKLQIVHDCHDPSDWRRELELVAWGYQLAWKTDVHSP